jgi:LPS-assembly lipoprotein
MHATHLNRRHWLRTALSLGASGTGLLALPGCGFQLRNRQPMAFRSIQLTGFAANSPLATELARALDASGVSVVGSTLEATRAASGVSVPSTHLVFEALRDSRDTVVASPTSYGQVRGITARIFLRFAVRRADGTVLLPASDINLSSDLTYNETNALAKMNETAALHKAMQTDLVGQTLRRLAAIQAEQLATPVAPAAAGSAGSGSVSASDWAASAPRDGRMPSPVRPPASSAL